MIVNSQKVEQQQYTKIERTNNDKLGSDGKIKLSNGNFITMNDKNFLKVKLAYSMTEKKLNIDKSENSSEVVSTVPLGAKVGIISTVGNWSEIIYKGNRGYVRSNELVNTGQTTEINLKTGEFLNAKANYYKGLELASYTGWKLMNGSWYYYLDGAMQTGWLNLNGQTYFFNSNGTMSTGWLDADGNQYYMNQNGQMETGFVHAGGQIYYMNQKGEMQDHGWLSIDGQTYFANSDGTLSTQWLTQCGEQYYMNANGQMETGFVHAGGQIYYMNQKGQMQDHGWLSIDGQTYFANSDGTLCIGWLTQCGEQYYMNANGQMETGVIHVKGQLYYMNQKGQMHNGGWIEQNGQTYFANSNGTLCIGWLTQCGEQYYMNANGEMETGVIHVKGQLYYMNQKGQMHNGGWIEQNGQTYFANSNGTLSTQWLTQCGEQYYMNANGEMETGWLKINGQEYYFANNGMMVTGTQEIGGVTYIFNDAGCLVDNINPVSGNGMANKEVYLNSSPTINSSHLALLQNGDTFTLNGEGNGWYQIEYNGQVGYIQSKDLIILTPGTVTLQNTTGNHFYPDTDGLTNSQLTESDVAIEAKAAEVCEGLTNNYQKAKAIYDWVSTHITYNYSEEKAPWGSVPLMNGSEAINVFNAGNGICQGYADLYAAMCRSQGVHVRVVESMKHAWNEVYTPATGWFKVDCTWAAGVYTPPNVDTTPNADGSYTDNGGFGYSTSNLQAINNPNYVSQYVYQLNANESLDYSGNYDYFDNPNNPGWNNADHKYLYTSSAGFVVRLNK